MRSARTAGRDAHVPLASQPSKSVGATGRGNHLALYAACAGRVRPHSGQALLPHERMVLKDRGKDQVQAVVLLLAHSGVVRPSEWLSLLEDKRVSILIHCDVGLDPRLRPFRFPFRQATAWEDISLFVLMRRMLSQAMDLYASAAVFYTCPGNGVPLVPAATLIDVWTHYGLPQETSILGVPTRNESATIMAWEPLRAKALKDNNLPAMSPQCYGSMWIALCREDARLVVRLGELHHQALSAIYRATYALASDGHSSGHARVHPDEEFVAYLLHGVAKRPWPKPGDFAQIMAEKTLLPTPLLCELCKYRVGHAAPLSPQAEARMRKGSASAGGPLFLRKVCASG
jgi:hypothetical protein